MTSERDNSIFLKCCTQLQGLKITDVDELNHLIDQLNALNFQNVAIENEIAENLFCKIISLISLENEHLLTKFCSLICLFLTKQERALSASCMQQLTQFLISSLHKCGECFLPDVLISFSTLLGYSGDKIEKFHEQLMGKNGLLISLIKPVNHDKNIHYYAFQCILNLLKNSNIATQKEYFEICYEQCMIIIKKAIESNSLDILSLKILKNSVKCLQLLFTSKNLLGDNLGELLGTLKCLLFFGLPGPTVNDLFLHPTLPTPDQKCIEDSQGESDVSAYPKLRKQKRIRRGKSKHAARKNDRCVQEDDKHDSCNNFDERSTRTPPSERCFYETKIRNSSSDSEYSDVESSASKIKSHQALVRQTAYQVLQLVVKNTDKKIIYGYWSSFLPDSPAIPGMIYSQNIFTTILKDPVSQVRLAALVLLTEMLRGSKQFLSFADGRSSRHSSFTSLSSIIAAIISEVHRCLLLALLSETTNVLLIQILKCYAVLCENTPYSKLNDEILLKLLKHIKNFLYHKDTQVQVASLIVFQFIIKSDQISEEVGNLILSPDFDSSVNNIRVTLDHSVNAPSDTPWIVYICKKNIFSEEQLSTRVESVQLLSCIVGKYFNKIISILPLLEDVILFCLNNSDASLQLHGAKLLDVFGRCVSNAESEMTKDQLLVVKSIWNSVINGPFLNNLSNDSSQKSLLAVCCDCLSTLPEDIFEELSPRRQIFYVTVLLGLASDCHANVRGAAIRCLGVYCLFPTLKKDNLFLNDVSHILIKSIDDSYVNVRFKASWSLGKLGDALFENKSSSDLQESISEDFYYSTAMACVQYSKDCDKVRANSVRALGIFLHFMTKELMGSSKMPLFVKSAVSVLKAGLSSVTMKVCWNICYAFAKLLRNSDLLNQDVVDLEDILTTLLNTLKSSNFKVRISAAQALTVLESRKIYGKLFPIIWLQLLDALLSASSDVNFKEIKHQENLLDQLCYSLCRLAILMNEEDLFVISQGTLEASEVLFTSMWKFGARTSADKVEDINSAIEHIWLLKKNKDNKEVIQILSVLQDVLNQVIIAFYGQEIKC